MESSRSAHRENEQLRTEIADLKSQLSYYRDLLEMEREFSSHLNSIAAG